jgi:hypothetical protein
MQASELVFTFLCSVFGPKQEKKCTLGGQKTDRNRRRLSGFHGGCSSNGSSTDHGTLKDNKLAPVFQSNGLPPSSGSLNLVHYSLEPNSVTLKIPESNCDPTLSYKTIRLSVVSCSRNGVQKEQVHSHREQGLPACSLSPNQN